MSVTAIVGGQFGSEGKGLVVGHIADDYGVHVRVGAANAGHTLYTPYGGGRERPEAWEGAWYKHVMQQLPCAAYANPDATLCIGPGAQVSPGILDHELRALRAWREGRGLSPLPDVLIDPRAHLVTEEHVEREQATDLAARIGSTSTIAREGIGAAQAARVMREAGCLTVADTAADWEAEGLIVQDVAIYLARADAAGKAILLEGTQGTGLSLTTGFFPYVTSRNVTAAGLAADCGVAPNAVDRVIGVYRTYPIRVAGNSGPFYDDSDEIEWRDIGVDPETERTTVTRKVRRVATFSDRQLWESARINGLTDVALTFADYLGDWDEVRDFAVRMHRVCGHYPRWVGHGPHHVVEPDRGEMPEGAMAA